MKRMLLAALGSAAFFALTATAPVQAQDWRGNSHHRERAFTGRPIDPCTTANSPRCDRSRRNSALATDWYGDNWAYANNQGWQSDSYNDWWNDQPWRAYPHWMMHNDGCARQWYAGDTLRC